MLTGGKYIGGDGYLERMDQIISSSVNKSCKIAVIGKDGNRFNRLCFNVYI